MKRPPLARERVVFLEASAFAWVDCTDGKAFGVEFAAAAASCDSVKLPGVWKAIKPGPINCTLESKHSKPGVHVAEPDLNSVHQLRNNCMDLLCCQRWLLQAKNVEPVK